MLQPVTIVGISGTRLRHISRQLCPKQFLPRISQLTMLQLTLQRLQGLNYPPPVIVGIVN
jgi:mannose-1-phosphate guanylyltransferase